MDAPRPVTPTLPDPEPAAPSPAGAGKPGPDPKRVLRRRLLAAGVPVVLLVVGLLAHHSILGFVVRYKAARLGVELDFDEFERVDGGVRLGDVRARLKGVRGVRARVDRVRVKTSWFDVTSVDAERVTVTAEGAVTERLSELAAWTKDYPDACHLPGSGSDVHVEWRARSDAAPWLTLSGGALQTTRKDGRFTVASGTASGTSLGQMSASWTADGRAELHLHGFVPPHPRELNGIVSGKETSITGRLHTAEDGAKIDLSDLVVRAGKLELKGGGSVERADDHSVARLEIAGPIPCADLGGAVAREDVGGALGGLLGEAARRTLTGSAVVTVAIEADSRDPGGAKIHPRVGIGCGVSLPGFGK